MTDFGRKPNYGIEWGNSVGFANEADMPHMLQVLHDDADGVQELAAGSRYEIRQQPGTDALPFHIGWYRCEAMDKETTWGEAAGARDGYTLIGQFTTPTKTMEE
jgi:hypothetical protein